MLRKILLAAILMASAPAFAEISLGPIAASFDGKYYVTEYPNGDKPVGSCTPPTGFTEANMGDGGGEICQQSASEFDLNVSGTSQSQNNHLAHKDCGGGECQIEARITNTYAGSAENFASTGIGIRETATQSSYLFQIHSLQSGTTAIQCTYGSAGTYTNVNGAAGQSRPRYVAVTYHPSSGDIKGFASDDGSTWSEVCSATRTLSDDEIYMFGASKSATTTLQATLDNWAVATEIDAYDEGGGGGGGPTLVTPIDNQSGAQGVAFSLSCSANFSGVTAGYTATGLPGAGGLSFNTSTCAFSGTPDADDVAASPFDVEVCASNGTNTCDTFQFTVSGVPGDTLAITSGTATVDCDTYESGGRVDPGDILQIAGGVRGPLTIRDCSGTTDAPIIIRNDVTDNEPATVRMTSGSGAIFTITNSSDWELDGSGKFVGADSGVLGIDPDTLAQGTTQAGIIVERTGGTASHALRIEGDSEKFAIRGVKVDGGASGSTIGISINDHSYLAADHPGEFRDTMLVENNYVVNAGLVGGVGMYIGANGYSLDVPLSDLEVAYNIVENTGFDCVTIKSTYTGTNSVHHNRFDDCNIETGITAAGLDFQNAGNMSVYANVISDTDAQCINFVMNTPPTGFDRYILVYNNILVRCGAHGIRVNRQGAAYDYSPMRLYNNTSIESVGGCISANSSVTGGAYNNICAGSAAQQAISGLGSCTTPTTGVCNNRQGTVASQNFAAAGSDNYELTVTSPACNSASAFAPDDDYEDEERPQDSADDQGADESAACP
jgi:hypothetical protein